MATKSINLKSTKPILVEPKAILSTVNELRKEHGKKSKDKAPITIDKLVGFTKVAENRSSDFGCLQLRIHYNDEAGIPRVRDFPNFGLEITSNSGMSVTGQSIAITIDLSVKAGKKKWQLDEIQECSAILSKKDIYFKIFYTCDEQTDFAGYSASIAIANGEKDEHGHTFIPSSFFEYSFK